MGRASSLREAAWRMRVWTLEASEDILAFFRLLFREGKKSMFAWIRFLELCRNFFLGRRVAFWVKRAYDAFHTLTDGYVVLDLGFKHRKF